VFLATFSIYVTKVTITQQRTKKNEHRRDRFYVEIVYSITFISLELPLLVDAGVCTAK